MTEYKSKTGTVSRQPYELYMAFTDLSNFKNMLPEDKREAVTADYDTLTASVQGMSIGVKVHQRVPYSKIELVDWGAPLAFHATLFFDPALSDPFKTDFHIELEADLNFMMKMIVGSKIKDALDKVVDSLVAISEGRMPEGVDPSMFDKGAR